MEKLLIRERFAPSPTGLLHIGHAYSALLSYEAAREGEWLLRIEDIDTARCKEEFKAAIFEDLKWLGLSWKEPVAFQSERLEAYKDALKTLKSLGVIYGCECSRGDIKLALSAHQEGDIAQLPYPRTCRGKQLDGDNLAYRLDMERALELVSSLSYREIGQGRDEIIHISREQLAQIGDIILARRDIGTSYHMAVVVDDAFQDITHVTRGSDMESETAIHILLQSILELPTPIYRHHKLIRDENGKRLAKRDDARSIRSLREMGVSAENIKNIS